MTITFAGHGQMTITHELEEIIKHTIMNNINQNEKTVFLCGGYGDFDIAVAYVLKSLKEKYNNISSVFVTPYITGHRIDDASESGLYDEILYPGLEGVMPRFAITKRNEFMVKSSDLVIAYVKHDSGGAYKTLQYAKRLNKRVINLAEKSNISL